MPGYTSVGYLVFSPPQLLDLAFVVNNSPSMAVKREKLLTQFPKLIQALADRTDGSLPYLRVAFLDGNMGTAAADSGDAAELQLLNGPSCGVTDPAARWLQMLTLTPANYEGNITADLTCLLGNLPQGACAYQQLLRSVAASASNTGPTYLSAFVRKNAFLGLVLISDEDDCSTFPSAAMFAPEISSEATSLRCATRGHACGGQALGYPTTGAMTAPLTTCTARTDSCAATTDASQPTSCSPLAEVHELAQKIKALKSSEEMVVVSGIFGFPLTQEEMASATYKIAPIPNPAAAGKASTIYDLWPICYDADHLPSNPDPDTGYDAVAARYGAKPGLRLSAFIDEFGANGLKFSMCQPDWSAAMENLGSTERMKLQNFCLDARLLDTDPSTAEIEPDCLVDYFRPKVENITTPPTSACVGAGESAEWTRTRIPRCDAADANIPCWKLIPDNVRCPVGQLVDILDGLPYRPGGTRVSFQCRVCPNPDAGSSKQPGCGY